MQYEKTEQLIGQGGYSSVYICKKKDSDTNQKYAIKLSKDIWPFYEKQIAHSSSKL